MPKVLVLYYSSYGHIEAMASAIAEGAREAGAQVDIKRVPELVPDEVARSMHFKLDQAAPIAKVVSELQSQMSSNVTTFAQYGALAALKEKEKTAAALKTMLAAFDRRRKNLHAELNKIPGISCLLAEGAFYLFPNIGKTGLKSSDFCANLLEAEKVAVVPGIAFGADDCIRLSYATSDEIIAKGVARLANFCKTL